MDSPLESQEEFEELISRLAPSSIPIPIPESNRRYLRYSSEEGAELWIQQHRGRRYLGCNPHFAGESRVEVRITSLHTAPDYPLDGSVHVWVSPVDKTDDPDEPQGCYPARIDIPDYCTIADCLRPDQVVTMQIAAFAHHLDIFADEAAFDAAQEEEPNFASEFFIPSGLFSPHDEGSPEAEAFVMRAEAIMAGTVLKSEVRTNSMTGEKFYALSVQTYGATYDVVATTEFGPITEGNIVQGNFWLSGRI